MPSTSTACASTPTRGSSIRSNPSSLYLLGVIRLFAPFRFLWNATRGWRLKPWRSPYLRWRIETYSGKWAEDLTLREICRFVWAERSELLRFLFWTASLEREARRRA